MNIPYVSFPRALHPSPHSHDHSHDHAFADPAAHLAHLEGADRDASQQPAGLVAALGIRPGMAVADLGAGTGYLLPHLIAAAGDGTVYAVDVAPAMVDWIRERAAQAGWATVRAVLGGPASPGLLPESVDRAVMLNVWHHLSNPVAFAGALRVALRPGGSLAVVEAHPAAAEGPPPGMRVASEQVIAALEAAGLQAHAADWENPRQYMVLATR